MLDHAESVLNEFCDDLVGPEILDIDLDPYTTEEKLIMSRDIISGLEPHQISEIVEDTLAKLPEFANPEDVSVAFDVIYDLISQTVNF